MIRARTRPLRNGGCFHPSSLGTHGCALWALIDMHMALALPGRVTLRVMRAVCNDRLA